jgi:hypothetical protein
VKAPLPRTALCSAVHAVPTEVGWCGGAPSVHTSGMRHAYPIAVAFALAGLVLAQHAWGQSRGIEVAIKASEAPDAVRARLLLESLDAA